MINLLTLFIKSVIKFSSDIVFSKLTVCLVIFLLNATSFAFSISDFDEFVSYMLFFSSINSKIISSIVFSSFGLVAGFSAGLSVGFSGVGAGLSVGVSGVGAGLSVGVSGVGAGSSVFGLRFNLSSAFLTFSPAVEPLLLSSLPSSFGLSSLPSSCDCFLFSFSCLCFSSLSFTKFTGFVTAFLLVLRQFVQQFLLVL
ncbi:hypothetical protein [Candidatus Phytoplasma sp. AldY-WA1]|uniref:hypothetical protein n=1 Tax=Candidatus Phytoplasma sp. AldY-WA1 TaxID=2852100 RepID=UPI00254A2718|nr:hypothetical protein [Candidatus Phytoplasma sp. AldY-WA1]